MSFTHSLCLLQVNTVDPVKAVNKEDQDKNERNLDERLTSSQPYATAGGAILLDRIVSSPQWDFLRGK